MAVGTALAIFGAASQGMGMYEGAQNSKRNAKIAEQAGIAEQESINASARRLADDQREIKASQRVAIAAGGGGSGQEQPLMLLADQANKMQLDQMELQRQGNIARQFGNSQSLLARLQGRSNLISQGSQFAGQAYGAYQSYNAGKSTSGVDQSTPSRSLAAQRLGV